MPPLQGRGPARAGQLRLDPNLRCDGRRITLLTLDGGPPVSAFDGQGSLYDLCERLLLINGPLARLEASL